MERRRVSSGTKWEEQNGYSRAVRAGAVVYVSGTLATDDRGDMLHPGSPHLQTIAALEKIERALKEVGAARTDVVRTRLYIVDTRHQDEAGLAHAEFFGDTRPCCTLVVVSALASPMALVEVEVDAVVDDGGA